MENTELAVSDGKTAPAQRIHMVLLRTKIDTEIHRVLSGLSRKTDTEIKEIAQTASALEGGGFKIRGACAFELLHRSKKLKGGRGKKDVARIGRRAFLEQLSDELGVTFRTLQEDIAIYDRLVKGASDQETDALDIMDSDRLGREYYRAALLYENPRQALLEAARRRRSGDYSAQRMREEAHRVCQSFCVNG